MTTLSALKAGECGPKSDTHIIHDVCTQLNTNVPVASSRHAKGGRIFIVGIKHYLPTPPIRFVLRVCVFVCEREGERQREKEEEREKEKERERERGKRERARERMQEKERERDRERTCTRTQERVSVCI